MTCDGEGDPPITQWQLTQFVSSDEGTVFVTKPCSQNEFVVGIRYTKYVNIVIRIYLMDIPILDIYLNREIYR